jgi:hypothetical protein
MGEHIAGAAGKEGGRQPGDDPIQPPRRRYRRLASDLPSNQTYTEQ